MTRFAVVLLAAVLGCEVSESEAAAPGKGPPPPARVEVTAVHARPLVDRWSFLGEARAMARAELAAGADGEVQRVEVRVGDRVEAGALLLRVDSRLANARVAAARASRNEGVEELAQARRDRERAERLGRAVIPEAEIERDVSRTSSLGSRTARLRAAEREAKVSLGRHKVVAPFAGVIAARHVDPGDWVSPGDPVLELVDDEAIEIIVSGTPELARRVKPGAPVTVRLGEESVEATVHGVVRALDPITRTARLRVVPKQTPAWLLSGAMVDVDFEIERSGEGLVVPRDALVYGAVGVRVLKVEGGAVAVVPVQVVATVDDQALVEGEGLAVGDNVVRRGNERLRPGQSVVIAE